MREELFVICHQNQGWNPLLFISTWNQPNIAQLVAMLAVLELAQQKKGKLSSIPLQI